eukprot:gene16397-10478_t
MTSCFGLGDGDLSMREQIERHVDVNGKRPRFIYRTLEEESAIMSKRKRRDPAILQTRKSTLMAFIPPPSMHSPSADGQGGGVDGGYRPNVTRQNPLFEKSPSGGGIPSTPLGYMNRGGGFGFDTPAAVNFGGDASYLQMVGGDETPLVGDAGDEEGGFGFAEEETFDGFGTPLFGKPAAAALPITQRREGSGAGGRAMGARPGTVYDDPEFVVGGLDNLTAAAGSNRNSFVEDDGDDVAFGGFGDAQEFGGGEFEDTAAAIVAAVTADTNMTPIKSPSASMISRPASRMSMAEAMQGGSRLSLQVPGVDVPLAYGLESLVLGGSTTSLITAAGQIAAGTSKKLSSAGSRAE